MLTKKALVATALIFLVLGIALGYSAKTLSVSPRSALASETVTVGALLSLTGDLAPYGESSKVAIDKAVLDLNNQLKAQDKSWALTVQIEDTKADPDIALEKLKDFKAKGINIVIGPQTSEELKTLKPYADGQDILLVSQSSTAPFLAIPYDNVLRFAPSDKNQGYAIARLMINEGITHIATVWRGDLWGMELELMTAQYFENLGGTVEKTIRYNPLNETNDFTIETQMLAQTVSNMIDIYGADKVGVLYVGFSETVRLFKATSQFDVLGRVKSFGSDGVYRSPHIIEDAVASQFATETGFVAPMFVPSQGAIKEVKSYLMNALNREVDTYSLATYDIVMVIGLAIDRGQSSESQMVKAIIPVILKSYCGALGSIELNDAGDVSLSNYEFMSVKQNQWVLYGTYLGSDDLFLKVNNSFD